MSRYPAAVLLILASLAGCGGGGGGSDAGGGSGGTPTSPGSPASAPAPAPSPASAPSPAPAPAPATALGSAPTATSASAAAATATQNPLCVGIEPFYWEVGDSSGAISSASVGGGASPVLSSTQMSIASASKWLYGTYAVQLRGSANNLTAQDIAFLNFTSGYTNMIDSLQGGTCPASGVPDSVNRCLTQTNSVNGLPYSAQIASTIGRFDYNSGHQENHASQLTGLGDLGVATLGPTIAAAIAPAATLRYTSPLMAGGVYTSAGDYVQVLRRILDGTLAMRDALGTHAVCTLPSSSCAAAATPLPEAWHYSISHWVEDDPAVNGDGAFSSAGAFGFYPWIDAAKRYYGVIARQDTSGAATGEQAGYLSAKCGRLIRHAWDTGVQQTGDLPI